MNGFDSVEEALEELRIGKSAGCGKQIDGTYQSPH